MKYIEYYSPSHVGLKTNKPKKIALHHSASPQKTTIEDLYKWHVVERGWEWIGYTKVFFPNGDVYLTRPETCHTAAAKGHNKNTLHYCMIGNYSKSKQPSEKLKNSLRKELIKDMDKYNITEVLPHRALSGQSTECFGNNLPDSFGMDLLPETITIENHPAITDVSCSCKALKDYTYTEIFNEMVRRLTRKK